MKNVFEEWRHYLNENTVSQQLKNLAIGDQKLRSVFAKEIERAGGWSQELVAQFVKKYGTKLDDVFDDSARQNRFKSLFPNIKDKDYSSFTEDDWNNFHIIVQHMDNDRDIQKAAREILKKFNRIDQFKYLDDRINCGEGRPQKYGTQNGCKKENEL